MTVTQAMIEAGVEQYRATVSRGQLASEAMPAIYEAMRAVDPAYVRMHRALVKISFAEPEADSGIGQIARAALQEPAK